MSATGRVFSVLKGCRFGILAAFLWRTSAYCQINIAFREYIYFVYHVSEDLGSSK